MPSAAYRAFTLKHQFADDDRDADALVERLGEAGCDHALAGTGQPDRRALAFTREVADEDEACAARWPTCGGPCHRRG